VIPLIPPDTFICSYTIRSIVCENFDCKFVNYHNSPFLFEFYSLVQAIFIFCIIFLVTILFDLLVPLRFFQLFLVLGADIVLPMLFDAYKLPNLPIHVLNVIGSFKCFILAGIFGVIIALIGFIFKMPLLEHLLFLPKQLL
jgi:hypothetical protein